jgi:O-antigen/teichoic acid export membrane protein
LSQQKTYSSVLKNTSIFGGVQVFTIIIGALREKVVATLLGPIGIGIIGILTSLISLVSSLISFGVPTSSVKYIAEKKGSKSTIIFIVRRIVLVTAILGLLTTILFSKNICFLIFGNHESSNIYSIMITGFAILFFGLENGELSILQATRKIKEIAKARIYSSLIGLFFSLPIYYIWRIDGIAYSLVLIYLINCLVIFYYSDNYKFNQKKLKFKEFITESKGIITLGFFITLSAIIMSLVNFITKSYVLSIGSIIDLGYYETGNKLVNGYISLVFVAMAKDYFPRISAVNKNNTKIEELANTQIDIALLFIFPIIVFFSVSAEFILSVLYSSDFIIVKSYIIIAVFGLIFKLVSWTLSYIILAKGESLIFFLYEIFGGFILLISNYLGFKYYGLQGLGAAFLIYNILYCIILLILNKIKYNIMIKFNLGLKLISFLIIISSIIYVNLFVISNLILNMIIVILSILSSIYQLNHRTNLLSFLKSMKRR